jgi:4'-phosphopantetheinyl transferase
MPLEIFETGDKRAWALWRITESEEELTGYLSSPEIIPENIRNKSKRIEWIAGRLITQTLLENFGFDFVGMRKDEFGKPFLNNIDFNVSLSHSFPFVGVIIDKNTIVGIDLEQPKDKLLRVAPRVLSEAEMIDAGKDVVKHCIYWCSKEALIKIHGKKDLTLAKNLLIDPFEVREEGNLIGRIIVGDTETLIPLYYRLFPNFVVVFNS